MKNKINISLILLIFFSFTSVAQQKSMFLGLKTGFSTSSFKNDSSFNFRNKTGFTGGVNSLFVFKKPKIKRFAVMTELNISSSGAKIFNSGKTITHKLKYISLNIKPRYYIGLLGKIKSGIYVNAGPYAGYLLSARETSLLDKKMSSINIRNNYNSIDYGVDMGFGWSLIGMLSFDINYHLGMKNIDKIDTQNNLRNSAFGVFMNLAFPILHHAKKRAISEETGLKKS